MDLETDDQTETGRAEEEDWLLEEVLCLHCLELIPYEANLCRNCKAPQNLLAATLPYERIHSEGFILRTAVEGTRSWLVLLGVWALFLPPTACLLCLAILLPGVVEGIVLAGPVGGGHAASAMLSSLGSVVGVVILFRSTANFIRKRREPIVGFHDDGEASSGRAQ